MTVGQKYAKLVNLASEKSSDRRRELLNEVTDMFFASKEAISTAESTMFGELMAKVAFELNAEVRRELSIRMADTNAPHNLAVALANDDIEVAAPMLKHNNTLNDDDLMNIVAHKGTVYQIAVAQRKIVSEFISDALVDHGNDEVLRSLLENQGARISDNTFDKVVVRAQNNEELHGPIVNRRNVSVDVLNQMFAIVTGPMRQEILEKYKNFSEDQINAAMERAKTRVGVINQVLPDDIESKIAEIKKQKASGQLRPQNLPNIWRSGDRTLFYLAFAEIAGLDYASVSKPFEKRDIDSIAILCRANNFERPLFVTLAVFVLGQGGMGEAETLGRMYNEVPQEAAARALRFMQVKVKAAA